jgi:hypothetical protein
MRYARARLGCRLSTTAGSIRTDVVVRQAYCCDTVRVDTLDVSKLAETAPSREVRSATYIAVIAKIAAHYTCVPAARRNAWVPSAAEGLVSACAVARHQRHVQAGEAGVNVQEQGVRVRHRAAHSAAV